MLSSQYFVRVHVFGNIFSIYYISTYYKCWSAILFINYIIQSYSIIGIIYLAKYIL